MITSATQEKSVFSLSSSGVEPLFEIPMPRETPYHLKMVQRESASCITVLKQNFCSDDVRNTAVRVDIPSVDSLWPSKYHF